MWFYIEYSYFYQCSVSLRKFWKCNVLWFYLFGQGVLNETKGMINLKTKKSPYRPWFFEKEEDNVESWLSACQIIRFRRMIFLMLKYSVFFLHLNCIRCPVSTELFCCSHGNWYESGTLYVSHETTQTRSQVCDMAENWPEVLHQVYYHSRYRRI